MAEGSGRESNETLHEGSCVWALTVYTSVRTRV